MRERRDILNIPAGAILGNLTADRAAGRGRNCNERKGYAKRKGGRRDLRLTQWLL